MQIQISFVKLSISFLQQINPNLVIFWRSKLWSS